MDIFYFLIFFIIIASLLLIIYSIIYNNFQNQILRLKEAEREIDEDIRKKFDLLYNIFSDIKTNKSKNLKDMDELKEKEVSSFEFLSELNQFELKIISSKDDIKKLQKSQELSKYIFEIDELNTKLDAEKRYYNDTVSVINKLVKNFPSNFVGLMLKIKEKKYFDNKNMDDKIEKDFKI